MIPHHKSIDSQGIGSEVIFDDKPQAEIYIIKQNFYQLCQNSQKKNLDISRGGRRDNNHLKKITEE